MITNDLLAVSTWIIALELLHLLFLPVTIRWGKSLFLNGLLLSKLVGLLIITFGVWVLGNLHILSFSHLTLWLCILVAGVINLILLQKQKKNLQKYFSFKTLFRTEVIFILIFTFFSLLRGFNPNIENFEKFADFNFVNAIGKSNYFPPQDTWFAGQSINYYYFGHLITAVLIKLTSVDSVIGYNLMIATITALSAMSAFTIGASFAQHFFKKQKHLLLTGIVTTLLVNFAGTLYTFSFWFQRNLEPFWFWRSIRLIPGAIHEFPAYSFAVADLHAHMINIPVVLITLCSLLVVWDQKSQRLKKNIPSLLFHGWILGVVFMTSAWDLPIYLGLTGVTLFIKALSYTKVFFKSVLISFQQFGFIVGSTALTVILFWKDFDSSIAHGVGIVHSHTQISHYLMLWLPALVTFAAGGIFWKFFWQDRMKEKTSHFLLLIAWSVWAFVLTIVPEFIYLKDIYGGDFYRGNTILKFYYQACILFAVTSAVFLVKTLTTKAPTRFRLLIILSAGLWLCCLTYPLQIFPAYYGNFKNYQGLRGDRFIKTYHADDYQAIQWLNKNVAKQSIVLEAAGDSYSYDNRVSTFTGLPTVQGWFVHEWLWRGGPEKPGERTDEVRAFYQSNSVEEMQAFIQKYHVQYVYVGEVERRKYPNIDEEKMAQLGEKVFSNQSITIYNIQN